MQHYWRKPTGSKLYLWSLERYWFVSWRIGIWNRQIKLVQRNTRPRFSEHFPVQPFSDVCFLSPSLAGQGEAQSPGLKNSNSDTERRNSKVVDHAHLRSGTAPWGTPKLNPPPHGDRWVNWNFAHQLLTDDKASRIFKTCFLKNNQHQSGRGLPGQGELHKNEARSVRHCQVHIFVIIHFASRKQKILFAEKARPVCQFRNWALWVPSCEQDLTSSEICNIDTARASDRVSNWGPLAC